MDALIVYQARGAGLLLGYAVCALDVAGGAFIAVGVDSELVLATGV